MFRKLGLAVKIGLGFATLIAIAMVLGGVAVINMSKVQTTSTLLAESYMPAVDVANDVERNTADTMYEMRGYALSEDEKYLKNMNESLAKVKTALAEAIKHAEARNLPVLKEKALGATQLANEYETLAKETEVIARVMASNREVMNAAAKEYMDMCYTLIKDQVARQTEEFEEALDSSAKVKFTAEQLKERAKKIELANDVVDLGNAVRILAWKAMALQNCKGLDDAQELFKRINAKLDELNVICKQQVNKDQIAKCREAGKKYDNVIGSFQVNWVKKDGINQKRAETADKVLAAAKETATANMAKATKGADEAKTALGTASTTMTVGLVVALAIGVLLAIFLTKAIAKPIAKIFQGLKTFSTQELDDTGNKFRTVAEQISSASNQVSSGSQQQAQGASEQASSLEETSSALEEMASMTRQNADNAGQANAVAKQAADLAGAGVESMKRMTEAIDKIKSSATETAKIIKTIDEIAFQTNLLALNAAVEAARAGEAGKGFAVVAEEVRNLARRSAEAAKNTADLIEGSQRNAEAGVNVTAEVAKNLSGIKENVNKMATLVAEIAAASKEQSQGIDQVNTAVAEMDKVVQQNAANAEESASASEEMTAMVGEMMGILGNSSGNGSHGKESAISRDVHQMIRKGGSHRQDTGHRTLAGHFGNDQLHQTSSSAKVANGQVHRNGGQTVSSSAVKPEEVIPLDAPELSRF